ncbi:hypothetical protein DFJ58DRAFT_618925, partial [Suillus subalutaceus]|uniref:uncharacterized protein n=1 Tax=Suillus subalutaceus TaxID=48586 RepID=UPI001B8814C0
AVNAANTNQSNLGATGVGTIACACHGCFVPHCIVDFWKGKHHMDIDYLVCNAIKHAANRIDDFLVIYDADCQWSLHFAKCVSNCTGLMIP